MPYILVLIGLVGVVVCSIAFTVLFFMRHHNKKWAAIGVGVYLVLFIIGLATIPESSGASQDAVAESNLIPTPTPTSTPAPIETPTPSPTPTETPMPTPSPAPIETPTPTPTSAPTATPTPMPTEIIVDSLRPESNENEVTDAEKFFSDVYEPYANREKILIFQAISAFAKGSGYVFEITEPTEEIIGIVKLYLDDDKSGDYVYFWFLPVGDFEILRSVGYYHASTNSEVIRSNSHVNDIKSFDVYEVHVIGDSRIKVDNTDDQKNFLFAP